MAPDTVKCPQCGGHMCLRTLEPMLGKYRSHVLTFSCECGFDYTLSSKVAEEHLASGPMD
jgi:hypothetical protein